MIGIIDYGMGNLHSVISAVEMAGGDAELVDDPDLLGDYDKLILPGVGAFRDCIDFLNKTGMKSALDQQVVSNQIPILGICLGMQVMARKSYEFGEYSGLGWIPADVVKISEHFDVPRMVHMGWNNLSYKESFLFEGLPENPDVYFVHSYYMKCDDESMIIASCEYGKAECITAAVCYKNICCTQFHPEKSQSYGLRILENFIGWQWLC